MTHSDANKMLPAEPKSSADKRPLGAGPGKKIHRKDKVTLWHPASKICFNWFLPSINYERVWQVVAVLSDGRPVVYNGIVVALS